MNFFEDIGLSHEMVKDIRNLGITEPTKIQRLSIPHIISKEDVIGESATGSGKTLAFACGVVEQSSPGQGLQALVVAPTRELTEQVKDSLASLSRSKGLKVIAVYGGVGIGPQINDLRTADVVVATPGRFLDHLQRRTIDTSRIKLLVLDEVDRMFDMGFIDDVKRIIQACPGKRQTLVFSATVSPQIAEISRRYMSSPVRVSAEKMVDPAKLKQVYYDVSRRLKVSLLVHLLRQEKQGLVMVFCNTRRSVDFLVKNLRANRVDAIAIHGGLSQNKRSKTIELFNGAKAEVLVCTDVAARGLHIEGVSHVYNYEIPKNATDYIHRIGRTARVGKDGKVINLLSDYDHDNFSQVLRDYRDADIERIEMPSVNDAVTVRTEGPRRFPRQTRQSSWQPRRGRAMRR